MDVTSVRVERVTYHVNNGLRYAVEPSLALRSRDDFKKEIKVIGSAFAKTKLGVWINPVPRQNAGRRCIKVKVEKLNTEKESLNECVKVSCLPHNIEFEDVVAHRIGAGVSKLLHKVWAFLWLY